MMSRSIHWICLLFALVHISSIKCMSTRDKENEIIIGESSELNEISNDVNPEEGGRQDTPTTTQKHSEPDFTATETTVTTDMPQDDSPGPASSTAEPPSTAAPKRESFLKFIDEIFQIPLNMLKMVSNILSKSLESLTSRPSQKQ